MDATLGLLLCAALWGTSCRAEAVSGSQLRKTCASPVAADQRSCETYIEAYTNGLIEGQLLAQRGQHVCPGSAFTEAELRAAIDRAFQDRPDFLDKDASFAIAKGLLDRFRCAPSAHYSPRP